MVQTAVFAGCLLASLGACLVIEAAGIGIDYAANAIQYGPFSRNALVPAAKSIIIDVATIPLGINVTGGVDVGIFESSGLRAVSGGMIRGRAGQLLGAYGSYIPRHASDFVGYHRAFDLLAHPIPVVSQVGGRVGSNLLSCNGGDVTSYCG
jgi:hypothetical protein